MLAAALEAEANHYIAELAAESDERGRSMVVRNGRHRSRTVVTAAGPVEVIPPQVNDRRVDEATGERQRFSSRILALWRCRSPTFSGVLPLLYLNGLSSGDFVPALEQFMGGTAGPSPAAVTRLTRRGTGAGGSCCVSGRVIRWRGGGGGATVRGLVESGACRGGRVGRVCDQGGVTRWLFLWRVLPVFG